MKLWKAHIVEAAAVLAIACCVSLVGAIWMLGSK